MFKIKLISKSLNIDHDSFNKLSLLILHSFFSGIFVSIFFSIANIGFVKTFGSQHLPFGYLMSGLIGYLMIQGYRKILKKGGYKAFVVGLVSLLILSLCFRGLLIISSEKVYKVMSFVIFLFAMPFLSLSWLQQAGLIIKTLNYKETKKYAGIVNSGATVASIIGYLSVPLILPKLANMYDVLLIAIIGISIALVILTRIKKYIDHEVPFSNIGSNQPTSDVSLLKLFKRPYILFIAICGGISMVAFYLIDFTFLINAKQNTQSTAELAALLSTFFAAIKFFELILSLLSSKIFKLFGLKIGIFILPLLCLFFSIAAFISYYFFQNTVFVFAIFTLKLFERVVNKSIEEPAYKSLYQLLPTDERLTIQARIDGGTKQLFIVFASIVLIIYNLVMPLKYLNIGLLFITIPLFSYWLICSLRLVGFFKMQLKEILKPSESNKLKNAILTHKDRLLSVINKDEQDNDVETLFQSLLNSKLKTKQKSAEISETDESNNIENFEMQLEESILLVFPKIKEQSNNIFNSSIPSFEDEIVKQMINNESPSDEYLTPLIRNLKLSKSDYERKLILNIFEKSNSEMSFISLLNLLDYPDYYFKSEVILCLANKNFKCDSSTKIYFRNSLETALSDLTLIISLLASIYKLKAYQLLYDALLEEEKLLKQRILSILSWEFDTTSISVINDALFGKQKMNSNTNLDIALELIEVSIDNELRSKIVLALEDGNYLHRLNKLNQWYFISKEEPDDAVILVLNYDYNKLGIWTKASAVKFILSNPKDKFKKAIAGYTYHSNPFLRALAFEYQEVIDDDRKYSLLPKENLFFKREDAFKNINLGSELFNLVSLLKEHKFFSKVSTNYLVKLLRKVEINKSDKKLVIDSNTNNKLFLILDGTLLMEYKGGFPKHVITKNYLGASMFGNQKINKVTINTKSLFYQISIDDLSDLILSSEDMINYLEKRKF